MRILIAMVVALASPASAMDAPPDTAPGAERIFLQCAVTPSQTSTHCVFYAPIDDPKARLKAASELVWLDAHPAAIAGARPGTKVKILVRLTVSAGPRGFQVAAPAQPKASPAPAIHRPQWVVSPHGSWTRPFTAAVAARANQSGEATIDCLATQAGSLTDCWVKHETPADAGFGEAALILMQHVRLNPAGAGGEPIAGRAVVDTVSFEAGPMSSTAIWPSMGGQTGMAMGMASPH
jgi:protein TonB